MKKISFLVIMLFSFGFFFAQNNGLKISKHQDVYLKNDTIPKVVYPNKINDFNALIVLDNNYTTIETLNTVKPENIESMNIEKGKFKANNVEYDGKIIIKFKPYYNPKLITLEELISKYTNINKTENVLYSIDGNIMNADGTSTLVDEKNIMQIKVERLDKIQKPNKIVLVKILTRSDENLKKANEILLRGDKNG